MCANLLPTESKSRARCDGVGVGLPVLCARAQSVSRARDIAKAHLAVPNAGKNGPVLHTAPRRVTLRE